MLWDRERDGQEAVWIGESKKKMRESEINIKRNGESTKNDYMYSTRKWNQLRKEKNRKY